MSVLRVFVQWMLIVMIAANENNIEDLFGVSFSELLNDEDVIRSYSNQLENEGYFKVNNLLTTEAAEILSDLLSKAPTVRTDVWRNPWQVQEVNNDYPSDHAINHMTQAKVGFVGRSDIPQIFIDLYNYKPILQLFRSVAVNINYDSLYLSSDPEGCIYGLIEIEGDIGGAHLDQHPLCVDSFYFEEKHIYNDILHMIAFHAFGCCKNHYITVVSLDLFTCRQLNMNLRMALDFNGILI